MMTPSLHPEIAISFNERDLGFSNLDTDREIVVADWSATRQPESKHDLWAMICSRLQEPSSDNLHCILLENGFLVTHAEGSLSFAEQSVSFSEKFDDELCSIPLSDALSNPQQLNENRLLFIHRRSEILVLPTGTTDLEGTESLRLFVSGIQPLFLRSAYAFGLLESRVTVFGDRCDASALQNIVSMYRGYTGDPIVVTEVGEIKSRWQQSPGRLHPIQHIVGSKLVLEGGVTLHRHGAEYACPDLRFANRDSGWWGWGHDLDETHSRTKASAEAIERYAAGTIAYKELVFARANNLQFPFLDPCRIISYNEAQLLRHSDWREFKPDEERFWVLGENHLEQPTYILADLVFNPFIPPIKNQAVHCRANSSGVAFGTDAGSTKRRAWLECVERDAFLRVWYGRSSPPRLGIDVESEFGMACLRELKNMGWKVALFALSATTPVIATVASKADALLIGCAAGRVEESVDKSLSEVSVAITGLPEKKLFTPEDIRTADDHTMLYRQEAMSESCNFLFGSQETVAEFSDLPSSFSYDSCDELYFVRLPAVTGPSEHVWRCLAPDLIPMTFGFDSEPRARPDVVELIASAKRGGHNLMYKDDVLFPHPFA